MRIGVGIVLILLFSDCLLQNNKRGYDNEDEIPEYLLDFENLTIYPQDADPVYSIRFERDMAFEGGYQGGEDTGTYLGSMRHFTIDDSNRVYIYDNRSIHVLSPDGSYLARMGGDGEGPGEFRSMTPVELKIQGNYLFAYDGDLQMIHIFSLETHTHFQSIVMSPDSWRDLDELQGYRPTPWETPQHYYVRNDSTVLMGFRQPFIFREDMVTATGNPNPEEEQYIRYFLMDMEGEIISDKVFEQVDVNFNPGTVRGGMVGVIPPLPSERSSLIAVSDDGHIFSAWAEDFFIEVHSPDGEYLRAFYHPYTKSSLNNEDILHYSYGSVPRQIQRDLRNADFPETWPALNIMLLDDENRLWISTITDDEEQYVWWVLDQYGELLAQFQWPGQRLYRHSEGNKIVTIKNGYLYTHETDEESGVEQIVRYRVKMLEI